MIKFYNIFNEILILSSFKKDNMDYFSIQFKLSFGTIIFFVFAYFVSYYLIKGS